MSQNIDNVVVDNEKHGEFVDEKAAAHNTASDGSFDGEKGVGHHIPSDGGDAEIVARNEILEASEEEILHEVSGHNSSIAIVAAIVPTTDDPSLPVWTFRAFLLGTIFTALGSTIAQIFYFKSNALTLSGLFTQFITFYLGRLLAAILPTHKFNVFGREMSFNPGPFNIKEHVLIVVMVNTGGTSAYATDILAIQNLFYHQDIGAAGGIFLLLTTQMVGYGIAGLLRNLLVYPAAMYWPANLPNVALYTTLHHGTETSLTHGRRLRVFCIFFFGIFAYQFLPTVIMPWLSSISILCLANNHNDTYRLLGSGFEGLGLLAFGLDWNVAGGLAPLYTPLWAQMNYLFGMAFMMWIFCPIIYFQNFWDAQLFGWNKIVSSSTFQYNATSGAYQPYPVASIISSTSISLNNTAFEETGPLYLAPYFASSYAIGFVSLIATIVHIALWHQKDVRLAVKHKESEEDIHTRLMKVYPEVPAWWYGALFLVAMVVSMIIVEVLPITLPWWGIIVAMLVALVMVIPTGVIQAVTNFQIGLNVLTELICGYMLPGRPIANVTFKCYGYMAQYQALLFTADLKLGHYLKIPPRLMFAAQCWGTIIGAIINYAVLDSIISSKREYLDGTVVDPTGQWSGRNSHIFYTASIIWGLVGPKNFFAGRYKNLLVGFAIGLVAPVPFWALHKAFPRARFDLISIPVITAGASIVPQYPANTIMTTFIVSMLSQFYARKYHPAWFVKYNYVISSALDSGTAINIVFAFIATGVKNTPFPNWWGNDAVDTEHCIRADEVS